MIVSHASDITRTEGDGAKFTSALEKMVSSPCTLLEFSQVCYRGRVGSHWALASHTEELHPKFDFWSSLPKKAYMWLLKLFLDQKHSFAKCKHIKYNFVIVFNHVSFLNIFIKLPNLELVQTSLSLWETPNLPPNSSQCWGPMGFSPMPSDPVGSSAYRSKEQIRFTPAPTFSYVSTSKWVSDISF